MRKLKFLLLLLLIPLLFSCQKKADPVGIPDLSVPYGVVLTVGRTGVRGKMIFGENGSYEFVCDDEGSPLCGYRESVVNGRYSSAYRGIAPSSDQTPPAAKVLYAALSRLFSDDTRTGEPETIDGTACLKVTFPIEDADCEYCAGTDGTPRSLIIRRGDLTVTAIFDQKEKDA